MDLLLSHQGIKYSLAREVGQDANLSLQDALSIIFGIERVNGTFWR